ncbi:MAG: 1,4-alpha-glucan branching protein GlgB [Clostridia bacterium]|nr:1,4-alpha-glucan branching protein GlgB [Clostridia bacterium]
MPLDDTALYLFNTGRNAYAYRALGCHRHGDGFMFAVWAPNARYVNVVGSFCDYDLSHQMAPIGSTGVWKCVVPDAKPGDRYKFRIVDSAGNVLYKADPFAFYTTHRPENDSIITDADAFEWTDAEHMAWRAQADHYSLPMSIYEVHLGSFDQSKTYSELAQTLIPYVVDMGYTHIELMPVMEHPLDDSWGYQVTGFFSTTSRYGTPDDLKRFIDGCHRAGIGVILDWVPAHFPKDDYGLRLFDGTPLFEHPDPRRSEQRDWGTLLFDYATPQVRSFMMSSALFWLEEFHADGLRVDAVSFMLYHDYCRDPRECLMNRYGGRDNLEAIDFLRDLNTMVHQRCPGALMIAEESTAFPGVTLAPPFGLGFDYKWNMGFMNDSLSYMELDSVYRKYHHEKLTFPMIYAFSEHYILPYSHDEVVYGKRSIVSKMPGEYDDKFAQARLMLMYQFAMPGKKLTFMGTELAQFDEWDFRRTLQWELLSYPRHAEMQRYAARLNRLYREHPALYRSEDGWHCFKWVSVDDNDRSVIGFTRRATGQRDILVMLNFVPARHIGYKVELQEGAVLVPMISTQEAQYGGSYEHRELRCDDDGIVYIDLLPYEGIMFEIEHNAAEVTV